MLRPTCTLWVLIVLALQTAFAQTEFKPRDADKAHAWRLYSLYKNSREREALPAKSIKDLNASIATTAVGVGAIAANNDADRAERALYQAQLEQEQALQTKLIAAWDKKFFGRYSHLQEAAKTRNDEKTKRVMDEIEFQLTYVPFNLGP